MTYIAVAKRARPTEPGARLQAIDADGGPLFLECCLSICTTSGLMPPSGQALWIVTFSTLMHSLFETKSLRLFSLLFGLGFALQLAGAMSRESGSLWFYFRRLIVLFVFGMAHALFFDGDILMEYALLGLILVAFRNVHRRILLILGLHYWRHSH